MRKVLACLLVVMMLAVTVNAQTSFVADELQLLTQDQSATLNERLTAYHNDYDVSIAVVTTDSLDGTSIEIYAQAYYDQSGFDNDCAILVICEAEGEWYLYTHGLCADMISNDELAQIGDLMMDDLQAGAYYDAILTFVDMTAEPVCQHVAALNAEAAAVQSGKNRTIVYGLVGGLAVGIAVAVLLGFAAKGRQLFYKAKPEKAVQDTEV